MIKQIVRDKLFTNIYQTRDEMGKAAAADVAECIKKLLATRSEINIIFAAAPSQNELLEGLKNDPTIDWSKINAFHMDEYVGLASDAPQGFANFLRNALFDHVHFKSVNTLDSTNSPDAECERYSALLREFPVDIVCMGIGENAHIAFNDPHVADFNDKVLVKKVGLDDTCRMQQVHDGCFAAFDDVPKYALTLTVPALAAAKYRFCVVPAATKANAVFHTLNDEISEKVPATIMRRVGNTIMYCDSDSASKVL